MKASPIAARQNECQLATLGLLVLPHDGNEIGNGGKRSLNIAHMGGKANAFQVFGNPVSRARFAMFQSLRKTKGLDHADGNTFAVQEAVAVASGGFKGVAEGVAEIEKGADALLGFILGNNGGFGAAAFVDGVGAGLGVTTHQETGAGFQPLEE